MAQAVKSQEPSMEEILASIRRVIAEDDSARPVQHPAKAASAVLNPDAAASPAAERAMGQPHSAPSESPALSIGALSGPAKAFSTVLDLTEPTVSTAFRSAAPTVDSSPAPTPPAPTDDAVAREAMSVTQTTGVSDPDRGGLMSSTTSAAIDSAFNALAETVLVHNARTLEDLVLEMLRPMLKVWLDDNLPGMVERLIRAEIERVSRGRGA
jgi:uncharacterized protein